MLYETIVLPTGALAGGSHARLNVSDFIGISIGPSIGLKKEQVDKRVIIVTAIIGYMYRFTSYIIAEWGFFINYLYRKIDLLENLHGH